MLTNVTICAQPNGLSAKYVRGKSLAAFPKFSASGEAPHTLTHTVWGRFTWPVICIHPRDIVAVVDRPVTQS